MLAKCPVGPPDRLHTQWQGPFEVISCVDSEYSLRNSKNKSERITHASNLKQFIFYPSRISEADIARRDYTEFFVESIVETQSV